MKKFILIAWVMVLSGCVVAAPHSHKHRIDGDDVDLYASGYCTQVQEAHGDCDVKTHPKHKKQSSTYKSSDGYTMITHDGKTLPACGETGGSQADNGSTCWF